jgi:hypothetical protein
MSQRTPSRRRSVCPVSIDEQEVLIRLQRITGKAHIASNWPTKSRHLTRLYGEPHRVTKDPDGNVTTAWWVVPIAQITFRRPGKPRVGNPANLARARTAPTQGHASSASRETAEDS